MSQNWQWVNVDKDCSQPFSRIPSQLPQSSSQTGVQTPAIHSVVPFGLIQSLKQLPQWSSSSRRLASQPVLIGGKTLEAVCPARQPFLRF